MRISDWSSDVCSSDLDDGGGVGSHCSQETRRSQMLETAAARSERGGSCRDRRYRAASTVRAGDTITSCGLRHSHWGIVYRSNSRRPAAPHCTAASWRYGCQTDPDQGVFVDFNKKKKKN